MDIESGFGVLGKAGLGILGLVAAGLLIWWIIKEAEKAAARAAARIAAMEALADQFGFSFVRSQDPMHDEEFSHFEIFQRGFARYAYNSIVGDIDLGEVIARLKAGDFSYKTKETYTTTDSKGRTTTRTRIVKHHFSYMILELPFPTMPDLLIRREGIFDRIASAFGKNDIDFESAEFSKKYYVKCDSRKFAYDIVHQRMIEFLLETKPSLVDIEHGRICLSDGFSVWNADRFGASLGWILKFLEHWPAFVVEDLQEGKQL